MDGVCYREWQESKYETRVYLCGNYVMKARIIKAKTLQAKIQDTKTINAIMR